MALEKLGKKKTCSCCKRNLLKEQGEQTNFFIINIPPDSVFTDGYYPVCKDCIKKELSDEITGYKTFIRLLMLLNRPFRLRDFEEVGNDYYKYLTKVTRINGTDKDGFISSDNIFSKNALDLTVDTVDKLTPQELRDCQLYWGVGDYTEDDYIYLMDRYDEYNTIYDIDSPAFKGLVTQICQLELDIRKKRVKGENTKEESKLLQDLMKTAGIAPSQEKAAMANDKDSWGTMVRKIENEKPIPKPNAEFADVDNIASQFRKWFLSPMLNAFGKENPYAEEYVKATEELGISRTELLEQIEEEKGDN